ncbi:glycerol-3-phosphate responsive antiterminator [Clostridium oceanicum]|uniref:Glycerol-3-phosphate responsive antiterminator n=1 Tax=Clostridium oceanicum TaxID=1543 RepID=A0ABN1JU47_9CLOT
MDLNEIFIENPVIAAIRNKEDIKKSIQSKAKICFVLFGNVLNIADICRILKEEGKIVFVHIDMIEGLKADSSAMEFLKKYAGMHGIITTKSFNVKHARKLGLLAIQRVFIVDSLSLKTGIKNIIENSPAGVEVMPGVASKIINNMRPKIKNIPIIAGGLIKDKKDVMEALSAGAVAISTTTHKLWDC